MLFNKFVWLVERLPYGITTFNRKRLLNIRSARNTIALCKRLGFKPSCLIDAGANESQWAYWLHRKWPEMAIHSIEPQEGLHTIGSIHHIALSDANGKGDLKYERESSYIVPGEKIKVVRLDDYLTYIPHNSLLKVDCEHHTARALRGIKGLTRKIPVVIVEICDDSWNNGLAGQGFHIFGIMRNYGYDKFEFVDAGYNNGKVGVCDVAFYRSK